MQTLHNIPGKSGGMRHDLHHRLDFDPAPLETPRHDQPDIAGAYNDGGCTRQKTFAVQELLGGAGGEHTGRPRAGDPEIAPVPFPAAHGEDHGLCRNLSGTVFLGSQLQFKGAVFQLFQCGHCAAESKFRSGSNGFFGCPFRIFRSGQFFLEAMETETVMDALAEDPTCSVLTVDHQCIESGSGGFGSSGKTGSSGADHGNIVNISVHHLHHAFTSSEPSFPAMILEPPPRLVSSSTLKPVSRLMIFRISTAQKPP